MFAGDPKVGEEGGEDGEGSEEAWIAGGAGDQRGGAYNWNIILKFTAGTSIYLFYSLLIRIGNHFTGR